MLEWRPTWKSVSSFSKDQVQGWTDPFVNVGTLDCTEMGLSSFSACGGISPEESTWGHWPHDVVYPLESGNSFRFYPDFYSRLPTGVLLSQRTFQRGIVDPSLPSASEYDGRLACAFPGGGKRRIFAIGNSFRQVYLRPYHDW